MESLSRRQAGWFQATSYRRLFYALCFILTISSFSNQSVLFAEIVNGQRINEPRYYYLGHYVWTKGNAFDYWDLPPNTIHHIDFRSLPAQGTKEVAVGYGFFVTSEPIVGGDFIYLGNSLNRILTRKEMNDWNAALKTNIPRKSLVDVLWDTHTVFADPSWQTSVVPLRADKDRKIQLVLDGIVIKEKIVTEDSVEWKKSLAAIQNDYRKVRNEAMFVKKNYYRKYLATLVDQYRMPYDQIIPDDLPDEKPLKPETTLRDNFGRANVDLDGSTASGGGLWEEQNGVGWTVVSNKGRMTNEGGDSFAYLDSALSSEDHYTQYDWITASSPTSVVGAGPTLRHSNSAETFYLFHIQDDGGSNDKIFQAVTGTLTALSSDLAPSISLPDTVRIKAVTSGSNVIISAIYNGTILTSFTDTTPITGNLRTGIYAGGGGQTANIVDIDNFQSSDRFGDFDDAAGGDWNIGTTWGGACSSNCKEGVDYPDSTKSAVVDSHPVSLSATSSVLNVSITEPGSLFTSSNTLRTYGDWYNDTGTFTASTGAVMMIATATGSTTLTAGGDSFNDVIINDGLLGYWKLDETAANSCSGGSNDSCDSSGYGIDGAWTNNATASTTIPTLNFKNVRSVDFDGTDDYVDFGSDIINDSMVGINAVTFSAWVRYDSLDSGQYENVIVRVSVTTNAASIWANIRGDGGNAGKLLFGGRSGAGDSFQEKTSTATLTQDRWHHIAGVLDFANDEITLAVDGVLESATSVTFGNSRYVPGDGSPTDRIGEDGFTGDIDGKIDEVRIYKRELSSAEINLLASGFQPATAVANVILEDSLDVNDDLIINSGAFDTKSSESNQINVAGDWEINGGVFTANSGTVIFDGTTQELPSGGTFYNFSKTEGADDAADETLTFGARSVTTVTNTWTLDGRDSSDTINLLSSTAGTAWKIDPQSTRTLDFVDVMDSTNINASAITCLSASSGCIDSTGNTNWTFSSGPKKGAIIIISSMYLWGLFRRKLKGQKTEYSRQ